MRKLSMALFFLRIVFRPVTGDKGDTYIQAWKKYRLSPEEAWKITRIVFS